MPTGQKLHRGFDFGKQLSMALMFVGGILLIGHLAGQIREGSASDWSLITGLAFLLGGSIFTVLFVILIRLHRIEQRLSRSDAVKTDEDDAPPSVISSPSDSANCK